MARGRRNGLFLARSPVMLAKYWVEALFGMDRDLDFGVLVV